MVGARGVTLRVEHRPGIFEKWVLTGILCIRGMNRRGRGEKLRNENLHTLCPSPTIILMVRSMRMRRVGHVACTG
jgi:hypothetical protein